MSGVYLGQQVSQLAKRHLDATADQVLLVQALVGSISMDPSHGRPAGEPGQCCIHCKVVQAVPYSQLCPHIMYRE